LLSVVLTISLRLELSRDLMRIMDHTVKIFSSVRDNKNGMLKSPQFHGTFDIYEEDNPLLLVIDLCTQDEAMTWSDETVMIVIEVVHNL